MDKTMTKLTAGTLLFGFLATLALLRFGKQNNSFLPENTIKERDSTKRRLISPYFCPNPSADPIEISSEDILGPSFTQIFAKSDPGTLCMLVRITASSPSVDLNQVSRQSNTNDFDVVPVARSYSAFDWERVAGPYAASVQVSDCITGTCTLQIPNLPNLKEGKFILISFSNDRSEKEEVSRFYHQTTFGPTRNLIDSWNYSASGISLSSEMTAWVKSQMNNVETPMTSHRAYFRQNLDRAAVFEGGSPNGQLRHNDHFHPRHPCEQYARWREYAFTVDDYNVPLLVTTYAGQFLLSVNGVPRTLVPRWNNDSGQYIGTGQYSFCWHPEEVIYGVLKVRVGNRCIGVQGGNPRINLPSSIYSVWSGNIRVLNLPHRNTFGSVDPILASSYHVEHSFGEALVLMNTVSDHLCGSLVRDGRYHGILGNLASGEQVYYAGNIKLHENSLEKPIADGGSALMTGVKPICPIPSKSFLNFRDSCYLSTAPNACSSTYHKDNNGDAVVVCGSPGEVANDPMAQNVFAPLGDVRTPTPNQKRNAWAMIALDSHDQLRQRMAWALSQIVVITPNQIADIGLSEIYLNYYDIFVRNAFGNYFDILKEVSYSPMMAEMLSYVDSKSSSTVFEESGIHSFPDENYAREVMQLFSVGVSMLNIDGTHQVDDEGNPKPTYDNLDIQNFARAWTGFTRQEMRGNFEALETEWLNRMDPMKIEANWRDPFPKMDLHLGFVGDKKPLCVDLPDKQFLRGGAKYRLLGSSKRPELQDQPSSWNVNALKVTVLESQSQLKNALSGLQPEITLESNLDCTNNECDLDNVRLVQVQANPPIYYEYVRPECVELAFYDSSKKISTRYNHGAPYKSMCANEYLDIAFSTCCQNGGLNSYATNLCKFDVERTTYTTAQSRCHSETAGVGDTCDWFGIDTWSNACSSLWLEDGWHWTNQNCVVKMKVNADGMVALVHEPNLLANYIVDPRVSQGNPNFFRVSWDSHTFPNANDFCANNACQRVDDECFCNININENQVFSSFPTNADDVLSQLHLGAVNPEIMGSYSLVADNGEVEVWRKDGDDDYYTKDTIIAVPYRGKKTYLKNMVSTIEVDGAPEYSFRNPPHHLNIAVRESRDAMYETDAVLETYFYHENVAPFLAFRIIQRFGISNPSPRYIETVATAFKEGIYSADGQSFGDGKYGNLAAMVAAITLDREAREVVLDSDPTGGSLKEPMLKILAFMRAMEFQRRPEAGKEIRLNSLQAKVGQEVHSSPGVFSFFLPEYAAPGHIKAASLTSPEAQVLSGPKIINLMNGIISLVDLGLTECFGGFAERNLWNCDGLQPGSLYYGNTEGKYRMGELTFAPANPDDASDVVDELSLLLTGGRLNHDSRSTIANAYLSAGNHGDGLRLAQKLIFSTPEYHSTNVFDTKTELRPDAEFPPPSSEPHKTIIYLKIDGGMDSFNLLVPYSGCSGGRTSYNHYQSVRGGLSYPQGDLHVIDASGSNQVCSKFGIHPNLQHLQHLYNTEDLLFVSNMGVLQEKVTEADWMDKTKIALFAHNLMNEQVEKMDINKESPGSGICGRMVDILINNGYKAGTVSVYGIAEALVSDLASLFVADPFDYQLFNPMSWAQPLWDTVKHLNKFSNLGSGLFSETWSNLLLQSLGENDLLYNTLSSTQLETSFPETKLGKQFETIAKLIKSKDDRGTNRDVFYAKHGSFDTHGDTKAHFNIMNTEMNGALEALTTELKAQGVWDDVTIVGVSEFGRTLTMNSASGSDHAWGGNYFIMGGEVAGKRILGSYPEILSDDGPQIIPPGIVIPTLSWDSVWNGISQWFGITESDDLDAVLPNRNTFSSDLFSESDLYGDGSFPPPTPPSSSPPPPPAPPSDYILFDGGVGSSCPIGTSVPKEACFEVAQVVGASFDLANWFNVFEWENFVPCGCFLWDNGDGTMLIDYNTAQTGCLAEPRAQLICHSSATGPPSPQTNQPTSSPTPLVPPAPTPTSTSYLRLEQGVGSMCPSDMESVSEDECLNAAKLVGSNLDLPDWLNSFSIENFTPCGCFLWFNVDGSILVDYNRASAGCLSHPYAQLICNSSDEPAEGPTMQPTKAPTQAPILPPVSSPTPPITSYLLLERGDGMMCPSDMGSVPEDECLAAAHLVGSNLDLPDWLYSFSIENFTPCGCFLWFNTDGSILVDYNSASAGCESHPYAQLICSSSNGPTAVPVTSAPTQAPTLYPTPSPTAAPTNGPTLAPSPDPTSSPTALPPTQGPTPYAPTNGPTQEPTTAPTAAPTGVPTSHPTITPTSSPTAAPTPALPTSSPQYFLAEKSVGGKCPSGSEDVPKEECLEAATEAGSGLNLPDWLNAIDWEGLPCGCFLWHDSSGSILVDYNSATTSCNPNQNTQMICKTVNDEPSPPTTALPTSAPTSLPTPSPTRAPTAAPTISPTLGLPTAAPTPALPTSSPQYFLAEKSVGGKCPSGSEDVPKEECLDAATEAGSGLNLPNWLNAIDWEGLPCGCFLWHDSSGIILVDYNSATTSCNPNQYTQMICKTVNDEPSPPTTALPTSAPTSLPTPSPTRAPTAAPTISPTLGLPTAAPTPALPTSSPQYFLAEKSVGGKCPSGPEDVPKEECLDAAHEAGSGLNLPNWLNAIEYEGLPCGCFLWHDSSGSILVDYNSATTSCNPNQYTQMICKTVNDEPSPPTTALPTSAPTSLPTPSPTRAPTTPPTSALITPPTSAPTTTPIMSPFSWEIDPSGNWTVTFDENSAGNALKGKYKMTVGRRYDFEVLQPDCKNQIGVVDAIKYVQPNRPIVPDTGVVEASIDISMDRLSDIKNKQVYAENFMVGIDKIEICIKGSLLLPLIDDTSVNFHETILTILVDKTQDFIIAIESERTAATNTTDNVTVAYNVETFICAGGDLKDSSTWVKNVSDYSQGDALKVCLKATNTADVYMEKVTKFQLEQVSGGTEDKSVMIGDNDEAIAGGILADSECSGKLCMIQSMIPAKYFDDINTTAGSPYNLKGSGEIILKFGSASDTRRLQGILGDSSSTGAPGATIRGLQSVESTPSSSFEVSVGLKGKNTVEDNGREISSAGRLPMFLSFTGAVLITGVALVN